MKNPYKSKSIINPQQENGHRRINNDVYHALSMYPFTLAELRVVLVTIDRSWGWDQKSAHISLNKFRDATNLTRQGVQKALRGLAAKRVLVIHHAKAPKQSEYLFNKHYDTWTWPLPSTPPTKARIPHKLKWEVWLRDNFTCQHCGSRENLTVDHIIPESKGGQTTKDNLQTLCRKCNSKKGNKAG